MNATAVPRHAASILVIEDEPSVSAFVRAALERRGYTVVQAASGVAGLERLQKGSFAGVISDIRMPGSINGADVHDCFSITEIVAYEILGLAEPGKGIELVKSGATTLPQVRPEKSKAPFQIPVNAGGGLIGDGHPVGATGVRQVFEAYQQLTEQAGARQIENAKRFLTFNMGGSLTTSVAMLWGRG